MRFRLQTRYALVLVCMIALIVVTLMATLIDRFITTSTEVSAAMETAMQERLPQAVVQNASAATTSSHFWRRRACSCSNYRTQQ